MATPNFELGDQVRDTVTGITGTAIGITRWLHGCDTVGISPVSTDNKMPDTVWVDVLRAERVQPAATRPPTGVEKTGGPNTGPAYARRGQ